MSNEITSSLELLNIRDVAFLLRTSVRNVQRLVVTGQIPQPIRLGRRAVRWRRSDILAWINSGCKPVNSQ